MAVESSVANMINTLNTLTLMDMRVFQKALDSFICQFKPGAVVFASYESCLGGLVSFHLVRKGINNIVDICLFCCSLTIKQVKYKFRTIPWLSFLSEAMAYLTSFCGKYAFAGNLLSFLTGRLNQFNSYTRLLHLNYSLYSHPY